MSEARMMWEDREYEVFHPRVGTLRRVNGVEAESLECMLAMADLVAEMVPGAAGMIDELQVDQLDRFAMAAMSALEEANPFAGTSGGS